MKRRVILFLLLLVGGAIVNVAVAWGIASLVSISAFSITHLGAFEHWDRAWEISEIRAPGFVDREWKEPFAVLGHHGEVREASETVNYVRGVQRALVLKRTNTVVFKERPTWGVLAQTIPLTDGVAGSDTACGWPLICLWYQITGDMQGNATLHEGHLISGNPASRAGSFRALPLRPLWPGFAINTLFHACILWLVFAAPFMLRRWRRIKRGLCPKCAYPVGTNMVCTECGKPVTPPSIKAA